MSTPIHTLCEVADIIRSGLTREALAAMPQARPPEAVLQAEIADERAFVGAIELTQIEARIRAPRTLFRVEWGYLTLTRSEGDRYVPPHVNLSVYLDEAIADPTLSSDLAAYLPPAMLALIDSRQESRLKYCIDSGGPLCCAELTVWLQGDGATRERYSAQVSDFLADFIGNGHLEHAVHEVAAVV